MNDHLGALCCPEKCVDLDGQMARKSQPNCYTLMSILFLISLFFTRRFTGSSCIDSFVNKRPNSEAEATMKSRGSINKLALLLAVFIQVNSNKKWYNICRFRSRRHGKPIFWGKKIRFFFSLAKKKMIEEPEETCASPALVCCLCLNGIQTVTSECCRPCAAPSAPWEIFLTCAQSIAPEKKVKRERKKEEKAFGFHDGNSVRADTHAQKEKEEGSCVQLGFCGRRLFYTLFHAVHFSLNPNRCP